MASSITRAFRHLRRKVDGKELIASKNYYKEIQKASRRSIIADSWLINSTTFSTSIVVYDLVYEKVPGTENSYIAKKGSALESIRGLGIKTYPGIAYTTTYKVSSEYKYVTRVFAHEISEKYGYKEVGYPPVKMSAVNLSFLIITEMDEDKSKPTHYHIEDKDDWYFKNDVETNFSR